MANSLIIYYIIIPITKRLKYIKYTLIHKLNRKVSNLINAGLTR